MAVLFCFIVNMLAVLFYFSKDKFWRTILSIAAGGAVFYLAVTNVSAWGIDEMFRKGRNGLLPLSARTVRSTWQKLLNATGSHAVAGELIGSKPGLGYGPFHQYDICERYIFPSRTVITCSANESCCGGDSLFRIVARRSDRFAAPYSPSDRAGAYHLIP